MKVSSVAMEVPVPGPALVAGYQPELTLADCSDVAGGAAVGQVALSREPFEPVGYQLALALDLSVCAAAA